MFYRPETTTTAADEDTTMSTTTTTLPTAPAAMVAGNKKRPRLDLTMEGGNKDADPAHGRERKRGKSMFGLLLGTLNKAKVEDSERSKSEAVRYPYV